MSLNIQNTEFIKSAADSAGFIRDGLPCAVFAGRSNVGKSSVINRLLNRKNFARASSSPGKTAHVNYFLIDRQIYLADLPGYGYAKVSKSERDRWGKLMERFFALPELITFGVLIVDARHKPTADDITMASWFSGVDRPFVVVANKWDKLKKSEYVPNVTLIRETLNLPATVPIIPFSAEKGEGKETLLKHILQNTVERGA